MPFSLRRLPSRRYAPLKDRLVEPQDNDHFINHVAQDDHAMPERRSRLFSHADAPDNANYMLKAT